MKPELTLIDGSAYLYRSWYAMPNLSNAAGHPTGAIYGVINMLRNDMARGGRVIVVFDPRGKVNRHEMYPDYKANRPSMPDDLQVQIEPLFQMIRARGLPLIQVPGFEADDVIATLAKQAAAAGYKVRISSADKDLAQLVNDDIVLVNTMNNTTLDINGVIDKFGIGPKQITEYLALVGDTSDNVPGVPKVGPKTAVKWLKQYGSLQGVIENKAEIGGKVGENLRDNLEQLHLSHQLVTLDDQLDVDFADPMFEAQTFDVDQLIKLYETYDFKKWAENLRDGQSEVSSTATQTNDMAVPAIEFLQVNDLEEASKWYTAQKPQQVVLSIFYDEARKEVTNGPIGAWSLAVGEAVMVCAQTGLSGARILKDFLTSNQVLTQDLPIVTTHAKTLCKWLKQEEIFYKPEQITDLKLMGYVLDSNQQNWALVDYFKHYLDLTLTPWSEILDKKHTWHGAAESQSVWPKPLAQQAQAMSALYHVLTQKLAQSPMLKTVYDQIEQPLVEVLVNMEAQGIGLAPEILHQLSADMAKRLETLQQLVVDQSGCEFNLSSTKQLGEVLFEKMQLPVLKKTPKGKASTSEEVLAELALSHDVPRYILEFRSLSKLKSTYTDKLPLLINKNSGRIHCSFNQLGTVTGRLSSSDPNLQNIPIRDPAGREIRKAFVAQRGKQIISADYSQVELRIMAHLSEDAGLLSAFNQNLDIHTATAAEVFDCDLEQVTPAQRSQAKAVNFGLIYGMSAFGLSKQLNIGRKEASQLIERYFARYPEVKLYMEQTRIQAAELGYVTTIKGRRLYLPDLKSRHHGIRSAAERAAINAPMQGSCADMIKLAMIEVDEYLKNQPAQLILQVHDELLIEADNAVVANVIDEVTKIMANVVKLKVPLIVNCHADENWLGAH